MTIVSKPATKAYRDNYDATFGKQPALPKSHAELWPICKYFDDEEATCGFVDHGYACGDPCPAFGDAACLADFVKK